VPPDRYSGILPSFTLLGSALSIYVVVARAVRGGSIESNLPPGISEDALLGLVVLGAITTVVATMYRYYDHLDS
jgi:hypothetical protein